MWGDNNISEIYFSIRTDMLSFSQESVVFRFIVVWNISSVERGIRHMGISVYFFIVFFCF